MQNSRLFLKVHLSYEIIILPASKETFSGLNGDKPFAISSAFTNSLQFRIIGNIVNEAVVLPAPLQPEIIYKFLLIFQR